MESDSSSLELGDDELKPQQRLFSFLIKDKYKNVPLPSDDERKPYPYKKANFLSKIFFSWLHPIMNVGYRRTLHPQDFFVLQDDLHVSRFVERFNRAYKRELEYSQDRHLHKKYRERGETEATTSVSKEDDLEDFTLTHFNLFFILCITCKRDLLIAGVFATIAMSFNGLLPLFIKKLINYVESKSYGSNTNVGIGIGWAFGLALVELTAGITANHYQYRGLVMAAQIKAALTHFMLQKSFKLSAKSRHKYTQANITSIVTTDLSRVELACLYTPVLLTFPIPIAIVIVILVLNIGVSAVIGIAMLALFLLGISYTTSQLYRYRAIASKLTDIRVGLMKELITNLKIIKYYSWEIPYLSNVMKARSNEINFIFKIQRLRNFVYAVAMSLTGITAMIAFLVLYGIEGGTRDAGSIFSSVSSFEILSFIMNFIPPAVSATADMFMALKRIAALLTAEEMKPSSNYIRRDDNEDLVAIQINDGSFHWETYNDDDNQEEQGDASDDGEAIEMSSLSDNDEEANSFSGLRGINLSVKKGEFIAITGVIGSGKSSLLNAIAGYMTCDEGSVNINGSMVLCGAPWVQNATIKQNIIFGSEEDREYYEQVVYACSLQQDLKNLPSGDFTEVGEKGVTLSGGQKARINLARSVYYNKDIILMDDVLSAVDARVGKHIVDHCFMGLLKDKTRLLATHQLSLINQADRIVFLNGDGTIQIGTMSELKSTNESFRKLTAFHRDTEKEVEEEASKKQKMQDSYDIVQELIPKFSNTSYSSTGGLTRRKTQSKVDEIYEEEDDEETFRDITKGKDGSRSKLIQKEEKAVNHLKSDVYFNYIKYGAGRLQPWGFLIVFGFCLTLSTSCEIFTNTWLSFWISKKFPGKSDGFYIGLYVMFNVLWVAFLTMQFISLITLTTNTSKNLNVMAIKKILHSPMSFMDTTPVGRILNRFTKDTDALDNEISENLRMFTVTTARLIGFLILFIVYLPWIAVAVPFVSFIFLVVCNYYQASTREIKRIEAVQRSFVYDNFSEVLSGIDTIKAYKSELKFTDKNDNSIHKLNEASFLVNAHQRWLGIHLEALSVLLVLAIALLCVNSVFNLSAATVGLILTYSMQLTQEFTQFFRLFTIVENEMNSVERVCHYAFKLPQEAEYTIEKTQPSADWPTHGEIEFDGVSMAYRPGLPLVLKDLTFKVASGEKIGICGRTGAGKSSIMTALYRITELDQGRILIDGIDVSTIGLRDLRSKISIIPQDPVLFNGTIRRNLDPFNQHGDEKLWDALRRSGIMSEFEISNCKSIDIGELTGDDLPRFHLYQEVQDEGLNFSLGERQLIAFARALIRDTKILVLDEATSSVDYETDSKIQAIIATEFRHCTILCIAHRLKTILNYDRIITLDKGEVREFDTPWNLFNANGIFKQMCAKSDITAEDFETAMAF
ncbi:oligomycin resistance ATP-dependent permease [Scheffersomyces xylosifermentans]|uniref:oligomycin resistance ATP-dependent permease n=1 Tax=Scheffersomyces xylosifermentans TaxID=1304137 RepID=UPI00315D2C63